MSDTIVAGDIVMVRTKKGPKEMVVVGVKFGRKYCNIDLGESEGDPNLWHLRARSLRYDDNQRVLSFKRKANKEQLEEVTEKRAEKQREFQEVKYSRAENGREALERLKLSPGDVVEVAYRDGHYEETIGDVNIATGKVGVERRGVTSLEPMTKALDDMLFSRRTRRQYRWVPANIVVRIVKKFQDSVRDKKPYPQGEVKPEKLTEMREKGWKQLTYGSEFIERSYVIATTPADARKGTDYECASKDVYFDEKQNLYWRETGSFD